jgi:hypothetical protein
LTFTPPASLSLTPGTQSTNFGNEPFLLEVVIRHTTPTNQGASFWGERNVESVASFSIGGNFQTGGDLMTYDTSGVAEIFTAQTPGGGYNDGSLHSVGALAGNYSLTLLVDGQQVQTVAEGDPVGAGESAVGVGAFEGDIFEVIGKKSPTADDVAALESYFRARYGTP